MTLAMRERDRTRCPNLGLFLPFPAAASHYFLSDSSQLH